jgi:hypothetical protein
MRTSRLAVPFALLALAAASCSSGTGMAGPSMMPGAMPPMMKMLSDDGVVAVASGDPTHPRLRYVDGQVSQNMSCAIRLENKLNPKIPPVYINGQPIGFC